MLCALCNQPICLHGMVQIKNDLHLCIECGASAQGHKPPVHSLPIYEGHVEASCEVWSPVCEACLLRESKKESINV